MNEHLLFKTIYWEIPCKDRHLNFLSYYALGCTVAVILFDTTKTSSLEKAEKILQGIDSCEIPFKILLGNKVNFLKNNFLDRPAKQQKNSIQSRPPTRG